MGTIYSYATKSWPVIKGCSENLPCAARCWAKRECHRLASNPNAKIAEFHRGLTEMGYGDANNLHPCWTGALRLNEAHLLDPLQWREPQRVAVAYHGDLFLAPDELIDRVFAVACLAHWHTLLTLTKRPAEMLLYITCRETRHRIAALIDDTSWLGYFDSGRPKYDNQPHIAHCVRGGDVVHQTQAWPPKNVWLGVSVEDQAVADARIPLLLQTPAAVRWASLEPMIGPVDLTTSKGGTLWIGGQRGCGMKDRHGVHRHDERCRSGIDWVVLGGESGPGARPMHPDWARSIRDQCVAAGVPFYFKQWGEFRPIGCADPESEDCDADAIETADRERTVMVYRDGRTESGDDPPSEPGAYFMEPVGKRATGRLLDGREWSQMPEVQRG